MSNKSFWIEDTEIIVVGNMSATEATYDCPETKRKVTAPIILTHPGRMHTDEVLAIAVIIAGTLLDYRKVYIVRSRDRYWPDKASHVVDIGGVYDPSQERYDHHHSTFNTKYIDGTKYASSGLVWLNHGKTLISKIYNETIGTYADTLNTAQDIINKVNSILSDAIKHIDNTDNGELPTTRSKISLKHSYTSFSACVTNLNATKIGTKGAGAPNDRNFALALAAVAVMLRNMIETEIGLAFAESGILESIVAHNPYDKFLIIPNVIPWRNLLVPKWDLFSKYSLVISSNVVANLIGDEDDDDRNLSDGNWLVYSLPIVPSANFSLKCPAPKHMRGLTDSRLVNAVGIDDLVFCHATGWITYCKSLGSAIAVAEYIVNHQTE